MRPFRFAVQNGPFDDPSELQRHALAVETFGYDELFTSDHVGGSSVDPFIPLMVAAAATTTLRVGPLVLNNEFHNPALLARTVISADQMTEGRVVVGMGTGYAASEHDAIGMPLLPPGERVTRFRDSLLILRQLLDEGRASAHTTHHDIEIDDFDARPAQAHVPFLVGGNGRRVVTIGGQLADVFQFTGLGTNPDGSIRAASFGVDDVLVREQWLAEAAGDRDVERSSLVQICEVGTEVSTAEALAERLKVELDVPTDSPFVLVGSVEQIVDKIERLRERVGISHYVIREPEAFAPIVERLKGR